MDPMRKCWQMMRLDWFISQLLIHTIICMRKMCLEAGKHVLCEKAFTVNAEQAQKLFDLAKRKASDHRSNLDKIYAVQKDDQRYY